MDLDFEYGSESDKCFSVKIWVYASGGVIKRISVQREAGDAEGNSFVVRRWTGSLDTSRVSRRGRYRSDFLFAGDVTVHGSLTCHADDRTTGLRIGRTGRFANVLRRPRARSLRVVVVGIRSARVLLLLLLLYVVITSEAVSNNINNDIMPVYYLMDTIQKQTKKKYSVLDSEER